VVDALVAPFHERLRQAAPPLDYRVYKEQQYDLLARRVRECLDMERIYRCLER
jgi:cobyric acid synthase